MIALAATQPKSIAATGVRSTSLRAPALVFALLALSHALHLSDGQYMPYALIWIALVLIACVAAVLDSRALAQRLPAALLPKLIGWGLVLQFVQFLLTSPDLDIYSTWPNGYAPFYLGLVAAAALIGAGLGGWAPLRRWWFPLLLLTFGLLGSWVLRHSPNPKIDVFVFQQEGSAALLRGENPYNLTFPSIYSGKSDQVFYGPGISVNGQLDFGFPYPPLSLFLALPGYLLAGDYRYAQLLALIGAAALLAIARPGRLGMAAAALLLFSPRSFYVLEQGWTEPFAILLLALTVTCACRWPRALPVALGLLLASKQTMIFVPILAVLLAGGLAHWRAYWALLWKAGLVALAVSLPLILGALNGFMASAITLQFYQPLRLDSLSYVAVLARAGVTTPFWLSFVAVIPALALALWRGARTPAGFATAVGLVYLAFFALNKQAFCNDYYFVLGALACAIAATTSSGAGLVAEQGLAAEAAPSPSHR